MFWEEYEDMVCIHKGFAPGDVEMSVRGDARIKRTCCGRMPLLRGEA